jgi:hypothetical protein
MKTRRVGLTPRSAVKAADQLQKTGYDEAGLQPLPSPYHPGQALGVQVGIKDDPGTPLTFLIIGDDGGVADPNPQKAVAAAIRAQLAGPNPASFVYIVGDIVYFNADSSQYVPQFYEPFAHVQVPILGVPGNHDGDTTDDPSRLPLDTFMANFCAPAPGKPSVDPQDEYGRDTQTQPSHDWTLALGQVTIIGLYSNVPSGGYLYQEQIDWLTGELRTAPTDRPLLVTMHHPQYSVDAMHGGCAKLGLTLDTCFEAAGRWPDAVVAGHVHDYQRFTRIRTAGPVAYLVVGNGGYHNLHDLASDATPGLEVIPGVTFEYGDASTWGYLKMTVTGGKLSGEYVQVHLDGTVTPHVDTFAL